MSKLHYVLGKWLSNLVLLSLVLGVLTAMALVMQLVRAEDRSIDLLALVVPIWLMGFPVMALVAALAVLFESIPLLNGGFGNIVFFFTWIFTLAYLLAGLSSQGVIVTRPVNDIYGISRPLAAIQAQVLALDPGYGGDISIGRTETDQQMEQFVWQGLNINAAWLLERSTWILASLLLASAAALPFDRFDPSRSERRSAKLPGERIAQPSKPEPGRRIQKVVNWFLRESPLHWLAARTVFGRVLLAEFQLLLLGQRWWWFLGAIGLWLAGLFNTPTSGLQNVLPLVWLWPVLIWAPMGAREHLNQTVELVFAAPNHIFRQMPALWLAGVTVSAITGSSIAFRLATSGYWHHLFGWFAGMLFIPSLALALGVLSKGRRLFEIVYLLWWYMAFNGGTLVDFMSRTEASLQAGMPGVYLALSAGLVGIALSSRWRHRRT